MTSESSCSPRPRLLVLCPSVDMYGSDRSLLPVLAALGEQFDITLVTPRDGPLLEQAARAGYECHVVDDWALSRSRLRLSAIPGVAKRVRGSLRFLRRLRGSIRQPDLDPDTLTPFESLPHPTRRQERAAFGCGVLRPSTALH